MVTINKVQLIDDVNSGLSKEALRLKYSTETVKLSNNDVTKMLKQTGLRLKRTVKPKFQIIEETASLVDLSGEYNVNNNN